jgi:coenzyme A diphosphatase NUDT7
MRKLYHLALDREGSLTPQWRPVSAVNVFENLREALASAQGDLNYPFHRSAVIVPLRQRGKSVEIVFELRTRHLRRSPGEVGFPGGRVEAGESPWQAGLRELEEELGVPGDQVEYLGQLPEQQRRADELIVPFVGRLAEDAELKPDGIEVEEVFTLTLEYLMRNGFEEARLTEQHTLSDDFPRNYLPGGRWERKITRPVRYLTCGKYLIWGLSANILFLLLELIRRAGDFCSN